MTESPLTEVLLKRLRSKLPLPAPETLAENIVAQLVVKALAGEPDTIRLLWDKSEGAAPVKPPRAPRKPKSTGAVS